MSYYFTLPRLLIKPLIAGFYISSKFYGVDGTTLAWISSFLSSRKQLVLLDGVKSSEKGVLSGVPQGTVLDLLALFVIY
jgi:hypothetical protein